MPGPAAWFPVAACIGCSASSLRGNMRDAVPRNPGPRPKQQQTEYRRLKQKKIPLRALIVEDESIDAEFIVRNLRKAGYDLEWSCVETEKQYREALATLPDIVLSDYKLPRFSALRALAMLREAGADIPFILVSGGVSDEQAVAIMRLGADDFLIKDRLNRLGAAVAAALERRRLREQARQVEARLGAFLENSPAITFIKDTAGRYLHVNRQFLQAFALEAGAVLGRTDEEIFEARQAAQFRRSDRQGLVDLGFGKVDHDFLWQLLAGAAQSAERQGQHQSGRGAAPFCRVRGGEKKVHRTPHNWPSFCSI